LNLQEKFMSDVFQSISDELADTVESAGKGVVRVDGRKRLSATGIIWREGVVVTASHVIRRDEGVKVGLPDGEVVSGTVAGRDNNTDLAVLKIESSVAPLALSDNGSLRVGHLVLALGRPHEAMQATMGVVSAMGEGRMSGAIKTDVVMYPGFSGGPLVDASGKVQGMNTSGFMRGASITVSTETINGLIDALLEHGHVRQGYLGVGAQPVRLPSELAEKLGQETGLLLAMVETNSPAEKAGLFMGDTIVSLDDEPTPHLDALLSLLSGERVGKNVTLKIVRGGQIQDVAVTIGEKS
jgi:S1-C subfamily serine protease